MSLNRGIPFRTYIRGLMIAFAFTLSPVAFANFFSVTPELNAAHNDYELYQIFTTGTGPYDASTMSGKIFPYPLTQNGAAGAPLYNGCYDDRNNRLGNLDTDNSCATAIAAHPGISVFRLFLGYKVDCADFDSTTGTCKDMGLMMNCQLTQVQVGTGPFEGPISLRECSTGNPIVRRAKANPTTMVSGEGCYAGQDGTTYPLCTPCGNGWYNDTVGINNDACTQCPSTTPAGAAIPPSQIVTNPTSGAISASQCEIAANDPWTCATGYTMSPDNQQCIPDTSQPCNLSLGLEPTHPSAVGMNDGKIVATYSGANGAVTAFAITSPTAMAPSSSSGTTATFDALGHNTYTLSVTDSVCTTTASVSLTAPSSTSCSACPAGSTVNGNFCTIPNQTSCPTGFTLNSGTCTLACTNGTVVPECNLKMTSTTINNPSGLTQKNGTINAFWSGANGDSILQISGNDGVIVNYGSNGNIQNLGVGTYTLTVTDTATPGCKVTATRTLFYIPTTSSYITKCTANICYQGFKYRYTCVQNIETLAYSAQDYYTNLKDACAPNTPDISPATVCNDAVLCPPYVQASTTPTPLCKNLSCSTGVPRLFKSASGLEEFAGSNPYSNPTQGNTCKTDAGQTILGVCSNGLPAGTKCSMVDPIDYYLVTGTTESCF